MTCEWMIDRYFPEDDNGRTVTVTGDSYKKCMQEYLLLEMDTNEMWVQQDGGAYRKSNNWNAQNTFSKSIMVTYKSCTLWL